MLRKFIERPVLSTVISIILTLLGLISMVNLPITLFPDIAPPTVGVNAFYPGASAEVIARTVAIPLEEAINGVENMTYMTSSSSNDGSLSINVFFKQGTNPDIDAVNVQSRVSRAVSQIPQEVLLAGITTQKQQNGFINATALYSTDTAFDEKFLQNYVRINIVPEIQRVPGVGSVLIFGGKDYSMRIWLLPDRLTANKISAQEVLTAIHEQNLESAPGRFGEGSNASFEYVIKYKGKLTDKKDYEDIVIRSGSDGSLIRLKDIARIEFGQLSYSSNAISQGKTATFFGILQTAGSNANEILANVNEVMRKSEAKFPKGVHYLTMFSVKNFLDTSIEQVETTLLEAFILVFLVVFVFLQDFRSTLIPAIAVPVAIIGTFFFMQLFGFTINLLTLFALVLAIGIVVDDAIVVVEAVHSKMERTGLGAKQATVESMSEISGAIVSITLVMAAVFIPVGFMQGSVGIFYRQFAFTLAIAILISAVNALTLSPALCALFLKNSDHGAETGNRKMGLRKRFGSAFNAGFKATTDRYVSAVQFLIRHKWVGLLGLALVVGITIWEVKTTPSGFIPAEDQNFLFCGINLPPASSLDRTDAVVKQVDSLLNEVQAVDKRGTISGFNFFAGSASYFGMSFIKLKEQKDRKPARSINEVIGEIYQKFSVIKGAGFFVVAPPTVQGFGSTSGFEFNIQDRTGGSIEKLNQVTNNFAAALMKRKEIANAYSFYNTSIPQYLLEVDNAKAKQLNVTLSDILTTVQVFYGSAYASDFTRFGKFYRVIVQADIPFRKDPSTMDGIFVKNSQGQMIPLDNLASLKRVFGPETVNRFNLFNSIGLSGSVKPGFSSGDALRVIKELAATDLPRGYSYEWSGISREESAALGQTQLIFILCIVFVYFLLAAQYESYILPLAVLFSVPTGLLGVFLFINLAGIENNIYVQVGIIMLIGLLAKNSILIVQYAVARRRSGMGLVAAALEASRLRLRPILMTSFAFIVGLLPLTWATGGSGLGNRSIGTGAVGGMLTGVLLGVFIIPVLFVIFQALQERVTGRPEHVRDHYELRSE
jgi:hydrophobic/amphiphilic exporter-1 (mainly G- bacteria), HAE1 family